MRYDAFRTSYWYMCSRSNIDQGRDFLQIDESPACNICRGLWFRGSISERMVRALLTKHRLRPLPHLSVSVYWLCHYCGLSEPITDGNSVVGDQSGNYNDLGSDSAEYRAIYITILHVQRGCLHPREHRPDIASLYSRSQGVRTKCISASQGISCHAPRITQCWGIIGNDALFGHFKYAVRRRSKTTRTAKLIAPWRIRLHPSN